MLVCPVLPSSQVTFVGLTVLIPGRGPCHPLLPHWAVGVPRHGPACPILRSLAPLSFMPADEFDVLFVLLRHEAPGGRLVVHTKVGRTDGPMASPCVDNDRPRLCCLRLRSSRGLQVLPDLLLTGARCTKEGCTAPLVGRADCVPCPRRRLVIWRSWSGRSTSPTICGCVWCGRSLSTVAGSAPPSGGPAPLCLMPVASFRFVTWAAALCCAWGPPTCPRICSHMAMATWRLAPSLRGAW